MNSPLSRLHLIAGCVLLLVVQTALMLHSGAFESDLGADPDEPAHAVTALLVRDYLASGFDGPPLAFARRYYEHYPKVALGHYPPLYYLAGGAGLLPVADAGVLIAVQILLLALLAGCTARFASHWTGRTVAWSAAVMTIFFAPMVKLSVLVMADILLAWLCLLSLMAWARYLRGGGARWSLAFGLLAAAAILTKGSGMMLATVPVLCIPLTGRWSLLKKPSWWLAALPVVVLAGPWMLYSTNISKEGMQQMPVPDYLRASLEFYGRGIPHSLGWLVPALFVLAVVFAARTWWREKRLGAGEATLWSCLAGGALVLLFIPVGFSTRYLVPMLAPVSILALHALAGLAASSAKLRRALPAGAVAVTLGTAGVLPEKHVSGYAEAARRLLQEDRAGKKSVWLVSSDARGEGAAIAEACFAMTKEERLSWRWKLLRGSKELSSSDWLGRGYELAASDPAAAAAVLDKLGVSWLLMDEAQPPQRRQPHHEILRQMLASEDSGWRLFAEQAVTRPDAGGGRLLIYRRIR